MLITLQNMFKTYSMGDNAVHALDDVSLTIAAGEFVAVMGASGSGKSTLLNILGCLDTPTSGTYLLDGLEVSRMSRTQLAAPGEAEAVIDHLNRALAGCHCARRFGADDVLCRDWNALTTADFARVDRCGWRQTSYVKLHFDEHKAFTSLYFLEAGRSVAQVRQATQTLLHDAKYDHVLRVKGFIPDGGGWVELNAARDAITVQPIPSGQEVLIVIGEGLDKAAIEAAVRGC